MGAETDGGYIQDSEGRMEKIDAVAQATIKHGMYFIVDWHSHHAEGNPDDAVAFFEMVARTYGDTPNIIYEIYNEPLKAADWSTVVKPYSEKVVAAIRAIDPDNLILVGSPSWSQDVDAATADPIRDPNLAYTLHFYAGTHKQSLRDKAMTALNRGFALFVSEWGVCDSNGDGPIDRESIDEWLAFMREHKISHCAWSLGDKRETASMLEPGAPSNGGWTAEHLTDSGELVRDIVRGWNK
jgi:aryl-phospho-beta-D-glucosidase BglC (GH1 family)